MLKADINVLNERERDALKLSFHPGMTHRNVRTILLSSSLVVLGVALFALYGAGVELMTGLAVAAIGISAIEKITYTRAMENYESVVRKLTHQLERLEGTSLSPIADTDTEETPHVFATQPVETAAAARTS